MNDNAKKWIEALESGEYTQGHGFLRLNNQYCCLGVACELFIKDGGELTYNENEQWYEDTVGHEDSSLLPGVVKNWLNMQSGGGLGRLTEEVSVEGQLYTTLAGMNDDGIPFTTIARVLREHPEKVFVDER